MNLYNYLLENKLSLRATRFLSRTDIPFYLIVFFSAVSLRTIAELAAYPYPIGYDVINYYVPMLSNFENEWNTILREYPFYIYILHLVQNLTGLSVQTTISTFATFIFGLFAVSILSLGKVITRNRNLLAVLFSIFVIVQIPVLRTTWDLHRDMFSLTMMFLAISILIHLRHSYPTRVPYLAIVSCLSFTVLSIVSDRMVGAWLIATYCIYAILYRERAVAVCFILALASFITLLAVTGDGYSIINSTLRDIMDVGEDVQLVGEHGLLNDGYNQTGLFSYFVALNLILLPLGIIGFLALNDRLLKISLIVAFAGSMTWLVFPHARELVADRWILLFSISLSVFAGYGFIRIIQKMSGQLSNSYLYVVTTTVLLIFAQFGITYAMFPDDTETSIIGYFGKNIQSFAPKSMQFNSIRVDQSPMILDIVNWINENTSAHSKVIGNMDWRGWFTSQLEKDRSFVGYERVEDIFRKMTYSSNEQAYLIGTKGLDGTMSFKSNSEFKGTKVYSNELFAIYRLWKPAMNSTVVH